MVITRIPTSSVRRIQGFTSIAGTNIGYNNI